MFTTDLLSAVHLQFLCLTCFIVFKPVRLPGRLSFFTFKMMLLPTAMVTKTTKIRPKLKPDLSFKDVKST